MACEGKDSPQVSIEVLMLIGYVEIFVFNHFVLNLALLRTMILLLQWWVQVCALVFG